MSCTHQSTPSAFSIPGHLQHPSHLNDPQNHKHPQHPWASQASSSIPSTSSIPGASSIPSTSSIPSSGEHPQHLQNPQCLQHPHPPPTSPVPPASPAPQASPASSGIPNTSLSIPSSSWRGGDEQDAQQAGSCPPLPCQCCSITRLSPEFSCCRPRGAAGAAARARPGSGCEQRQPGSSSAWFFKVTEVVGRKEKRARKKKLTQKPQGIFCLFRILGREKIATVIQSIQDNNSLFTVCMQRWQAGSTAQARGMRNLPRSHRGSDRFC